MAHMPAKRCQTHLPGLHVSYCQRRASPGISSTKYTEYAVTLHVSGNMWRQSTICRPGGDGCLVKSKRLMRPRQRKSDDGRLDSTRLGQPNSCGLCRPVDLHNQPVSPSSANAQALAATSEPLVDVWWKRPCAVLAVRPNPCPNLLAGHGPAPQLHQAGFELWMLRSTEDAPQLAHLD